MVNGEGAEINGPKELNHSSGDQSGQSPFHDELRSMDSFKVAQAESFGVAATDHLAEFRKEFPTDEDFVKETRDSTRAHVGLSPDASSEELMKATAQDVYKQLSGPNTYSRELIDDVLKDFGLQSLDGLTPEKVLQGLVHSQTNYSGFKGAFSYEGLENAVIQKQMEQMKTGTLPVDYD